MSILSRFTSWITGTATSVKKSISVAIRASLGGGMPSGGWASDHREEVRHFTGYNYVAIHAIAQQVAGSTLRVFNDADDATERQSVRKALRSQFGTLSRYKSLYGDKNRELEPLPASHPLVHILMHPNPYETRADFLYRMIMQVRLTGKVLIWNVPSVAGPTCERYVLPTAMCTFMPPTAECPWGSWLVSPQASRYAPVVDDGFIDGGPAWTYVLGKNIDARQIQCVMYPHPYWLNDSQSPISAGSNWVDLEQQVNVARNAQLRNGVDGSLLWELPPDVNPDQDEVERATAKINAKYGGPESVGKVIMAQGGTKVTPLSTTPKEMCYSEAFEQAKSANLCLHGTPEVALGGAPPGAFAAYFMSMKAWRHATVQPICDKFAESDTQHLAPQFGEGLVVEYESDMVDDPDMLEKQLANDLAAGTITMNEWRTLRGRKPIDGPDGDKLLGGKGDPQAGQPGSEGDTGGKTGNPFDGIPKITAPETSEATEQPDAEMPGSPFTRSKTLLAAMRAAEEVDGEVLSGKLEPMIERAVEARMKAIQFGVNSELSNRLRNVADDLARQSSDHESLPGNVFVSKTIPGRVWYSSNDGDTTEFVDLVEKALRAVPGVTNVRIESEYVPGGAGWINVRTGIEKSLKAMKARDPSKPYKFSSTQINLPKQLADQVRAMGQLIPDSELADDGREDDIHVTVKYGIHGNDVRPIREACENFGSVDIVLGKTSFFECDEYDVVKVDVVSPSLMKLNEVVADSCEVTDTHPVYIPHVTIAYVKSGDGQKYAGMDDVDGESFTADSFVFISKNKNRYGVDLVPASKENDAGFHRQSVVEKALSYSTNGNGHHHNGNGHTKNGHVKKSDSLSTSSGSDGGFLVHPSELKDNLILDTSAGPETHLCPFCGRVARSQDDANDICESGHVFPHEYGIEKHPESDQIGDITPDNGELIVAVDEDKSADNGRDDGNGMPPVPTIDTTWPPVPTLVPKVVDSPNYDPDSGNVRQESALKSVAYEEEAAIEAPNQPEPSQVSQQENLPKPKSTNRRRKRNKPDQQPGTT